MKRFRLYFWIWAILIFAVSSYPNLKSPVKLSEKISWDKIAHFTEYLILAFLYYKYRFLSGLQINKIQKQLFYMLLIIPVFDELHQLLIPGRSFSFLDILADMMGFATIILYLNYRKKRILLWEN
ncbi:MAG: VanZ family protein [Candidatus Cloacimonadales bacterium]|jgi:VanZ family protein|nr:VanZ family protein [Candidatus Cloacimonadota bacterium]MDX9976445.1 VanZ family protein [Candidatus Cloacimonadales bacterium]